MTQVRIEVFICGQAKTKGSMTPMRNPKTGRIFLKEPPKSKAWQVQMSHEMAIAMNLARARMAHSSIGVRLTIEAVLKRPKNHYGTGKNSDVIKPQYLDIDHVVKPDLDKLTRACKDAGTGVIWTDDSQVCSFKKADKRYENGNERIGILIIAEWEEKL